MAFFGTNGLQVGSFQSVTAVADGSNQLYGSVRLGMCFQNARCFDGTGVDLGIPLENRNCHIVIVKLWLVAVMKCDVCDSYVKGIPAGTTESRQVGLLPAG